MDIKLDQPIDTAVSSPNRLSSIDRQILSYWAIATLCGLVCVGDWITSWNVAGTLGRPTLMIYLLLSFALSQLLYAVVAQHGNRSIRPLPTAVFAVGNGIAETLAFAAVYRVGELIGSALFGPLGPQPASVAGFVCGVITFSIYGGAIHALFWLRALPPHLDDRPRSRRIRRLRPLAEVALVVGWSLCFWLERDLWTVVAFHVLVDLGLMIKVRPQIFTAQRQPD